MGGGDSPAQPPHHPQNVGQKGKQNAYTISYSQARDGQGGKPSRKCCSLRLPLAILNVQYDADHHHHM